MPVDLINHIPAPSKIKTLIESAARDFAVKKMDTALETLHQLLEDVHLHAPHLAPYLHYNIGIIYMEKGNLQMAAACFENILRQYNSLRDVPRELTGLTEDLSAVYLYQGKYQLAKTHLKSLLLTRLRHGNWRKLATAFFYLGLVNTKEKKRLRSFFQLLLSLLLYNFSGNTAGAADAFDALGKLAVDYKKFSIALRCHGAALKKRRRLDDEPALAKTLFNIGTVYLRKGNAQDALKHHQQAMSIRNKYKDFVGISNSRNSMGLILMRLGKLKSARKQLRAAYYMRWMLQDEVNLGKVKKNMVKLEAMINGR